ncbi:phage tail protein [Burkholderia territorii]|nr:phage tail protein [Burkholderia territorii]
MAITAASGSATLKADEIVVESSLGGLGYRIANFNKSINLATTGAGGMDSGAAPASGYVAIYAIYNPSNGVSALLATNCTGSIAPEVYNAGSMPAGYSASALVSVWATDSNGRLTVGFQRDRNVSITSTAAITTSSNVAAQTQLSIAGVVPMNARTISGVLHEASTATGSCVATITPGLGSVGGQNLSGALTASQVSECNFSLSLLTPQQVYYTTSVSAGTPTFIIYISGYTI